MIRPQPWARMAGTASRMQWKAADTLTASAVFHASVEKLSIALFHDGLPTFQSTDFGNRLHFCTAGLSCHDGSRAACLPERHYIFSGIALAVWFRWRDALPDGACMDPFSSPVSGHGAVKLFRNSLREIYKTLTISV